MRLNEEQQRAGRVDIPNSDKAAKDANDSTEEVSSLYDRYAGQLIASLRKSFGDGPPDPDDIAHQAFQKLLEREDLHKVSNLRAYLWRTARNLVLANKRSEVSRSRYDFEVEQLFFPLKNDVSTPERVLVVKEQLEAISDILAEMPGAEISTRN
ncbi:MAG: sigma-70 family RNA polymerase sigma factor [Pseudomonadota bacterium]